MPLHLAFIWALRLDLGTSCSSEHITDCYASLATHSYLDEQYYNLYSNKIILNYKDLIEMSITKKSFAHSFMMNIYSSQMQYVIILFQTQVFLLVRIRRLIIKMFDSQVEHEKAQRLGIKLPPPPSLHITLINVKIKQGSE